MRMAVGKPPDGSVAVPPGAEHRNARTAVACSVAACGKVQSRRELRTLDAHPRQIPGDSEVAEHGHELLSCLYGQVVEDPGVLYG